MKLFPSLLFAIVQPALAENAPEHIKAIEVAREGNPTKALQLMDEVGKKQGWYDTLIYDYIVILTWAKRDLEAYNLFQSKVNKAAAPPYVIDAIATACRNLKLFSEAKQFYTLLKEKEPHNPAVEVGLANIELDLQRPYEAILLLTTAEKKYPNHIDICLILGKSYYAAEKYADALRYYNKVLSINPNQKDAAAGQALCLSHLKSPFEALEKARKHPGYFSKEEIRDMEANRAATLIMWGKVDRDNIKTFKDRYVYLDRSITDLKKQIDETDDANRKLRLQFDLIVAYVFRNRNKDAIEEYEKILKSGKTIQDFPIYVLEGVGDAFLTLRHPEKAKEVFKYILEKNYKNPKAIEGYFYAILECNEPEAALEFIKSNRDYYRKWIDLIDTAYLNKDRLITEETYNASFLFGNLLSKADEITKEGIQTMPMNETMRSLRGNVLQARGLPRAAEMEYDIGLTNSPENTSLLLSKARAHLSLNEPEDAAQIMEQVEKTYPESLDLKRFKDEWKSYNARELTSDTTFETGGAQNIGGESLTTDNRLYSQTFANHYRAFLSGFYQWGTFSEGVLNQVLEGAGIEYRNRNIRLLGEINSTQWGRTRLGSSLEAEYQPQDTIKISAKADVISRQTPGRAIINNITSNYYNIGFEYYKNESFQLGISGFLQTFSDKNTWLGGSGFIKGRIIEKPRYTLDLRVDAGARSSRTNDVLYYSPLQDRYMNLSSPFTQLLYQRYEHSLSHIITPDIGNYWQKGFGNRLTFGISYEQRWKYQNWYEIGYGFSRRRNFYDGQKQYSTTFLLKINFKF